MGALARFPLNLDLVRPPLAAVGGGASVSTSSTSCGCSPPNLTLFLGRVVRMVPVSTWSGLTRSLWRPLKAVPVVSDSWATKLGRLMTPWLEIGSMDSEGGTVKVGVLRVGLTWPETAGTAGKIPVLAGAGCCSKAGLGLGWNLRLVSTSEASLGRNLWKLVTAGTVGTLSTWLPTWGLTLGETNPEPDGLNLLGG